MNRTLLGICACSVAALSATAAWTAADTTPEGALVPPFSHVFTEAGDFDGYTILDLDGQGGWKMEEGQQEGEYVPCVKGTSGWYNVPSMNDWLITPRLYLEEGKAYRVTVNMSSQSNACAERFEVKYGKENTADGMTGMVISPTEITNTEGRDFDGYIIPAESGEHHVGVHGISDPETWRLYCYYIRIGAPTPLTAPGAVSGLAVVPDPQWEMKATVSFTTPGTDMAGDPVGGTMDVDIYRDGEKIGTVEGCSPATTYSFEDNNSAGTPMERPREYEYTVIPRNASGEGYLAKAANYVGPNVPGDVENIHIAEMSPGIVKVTWEAPATDRNGNPVPAGKVRYALELLGNGEENVLTTDHAGTDYTVTVCEPTEQTFACVRIVALTSAGRSDGVMSPTIPVGEADEAPYLESFADGRLRNLTGTEIVTQNGSSRPQAQLCVDADFPSVGASDNDNGFAYGRMPSAGDQVGFFSGKIDLLDMKGLKFALNIFKFNDSHANTFTISMRCIGEEFTEIATVSAADFTEPGWHKTMSDIPERFEGKTVQFEITMTNVNSMNSFMDRARIYVPADINLSAREITLPSEAQANEPFTVAVTVDNVGELAAGGYTVELYRNGMKVDEQTPAEALEPDAFTTVEFTQNLPVTEAPEQGYSARVVIDGDEDPTDNSTEVAYMSLKMPSYPVVDTLEGTADGNGGIILTWSAPDLAGSETEHVVMDFETFVDHATDLSPFTNHDGDGLASGTYTDEDIPGITGEPAAWYVIDSRNEGNGVGTGNNGSDKFVMVAYTQDEEADVNRNDDWLITPELYGGEQTISFYVRVCNSWYPETLEVLVSETDNDPASFTQYGVLALADQEWTRVEADIPAGVRYVAFRYISEDQYYIALDDIEYAPAGGKPMLELVGYNIYRDGIRINSEPVAETTFTDSGCEPDTEHTYAVTAVYNKGESCLGNEVRMQLSGIAGAAQESADTPAEYFNMAGMKVASGTVGTPVPALPAGVYVRSTPVSVTKIVVK